MCCDQSFAHLFVSLSHKEFSASGKKKQQTDSHTRHKNHEALAGTQLVQKCPNPQHVLYSMTPLRAFIPSINRTAAE